MKNMSKTMTKKTNKTLTIEKLKEVTQCFLERQLDATLEDCRRCKNANVCNILEEVWRTAFEEAEGLFHIDTDEEEEI